MLVGLLLAVEFLPEGPEMLLRIVYAGTDELHANEPEEVHEDVVVLNNNLAEGLQMVRGCLKHAEPASNHCQAQIEKQKQPFLVHINGGTLCQPVVFFQVEFESRTRLVQQRPDWHIAVAYACFKCLFFLAVGLNELHLEGLGSNHYIIHRFHLHHGVPISRQVPQLFVHVTTEEPHVDPLVDGPEYWSKVLVQQASDRGVHVHVLG